MIGYFTSSGLICTLVICMRLSFYFFMSFEEDVRRAAGELFKSSLTVYLSLVSSNKDIEGNVNLMDKYIH